MDVINYSKIKKLKAELGEYKDRNNLKIATLDKELNDFQKTLASVNVNQEAKQTVSGYGVVSLPPNAANGQVSATLKGRTLKNELNYNPETWAEWNKNPSGQIVADSTGLELISDGTTAVIGAYLNTNLKPSTKYGLLYYVVSSDISGTLTAGIASRAISFGSVGKTVGNQKSIAISQSSIANNSFIMYIGSSSSNGQKIKIALPRMFELPTGSEIENDFNTMTADQLAMKYPYISGGSAKSTVSVGRFKGVGKNLFDGRKVINGYKINNLTGALATLTGVSASDFIRIKPSTAYCYYYGLTFIAREIAFYDINKTYIQGMSGANVVAFITPQNAYYVRLTVSTSELDNAQLEKGITATPYEPYQESNQYIIATEADGSIAEARSLPNGTNDEISESKHIKRVSDEVILNGSLNWDAILGLTNTYRIRLLGWAIPNNALQTISNSGTGRSNDGNYPITSSASTDSRGITIGAVNDGNLYVRIEKSKIEAMPSGATINGCKEYLNQYPITLTYQLATPVITPVQTSGTLLSYSSGTVYWENAVADAGIYNNGMIVLHQDLPIKELEKLSKIDFMTGLETELDVSKAVINSDKLSFTHPDLTDGDIVFFTYFYDRESTVPELSIEYFDSRYVLKDSVTGKYYKVVQTVADGVLSNSLVEV